MSLRKADTIKQYASKIDDNIEELHLRKDTLNDELAKVKAEMKESIDNIDNPDLQAELTRITSTREVVAESINDRQQELEELQDELEQSLAKQKDEENFDKAVKLTQSAEQNRKRQNELINEFDEVVEPILNKMADINTNWRNNVGVFMQTVAALEPSFFRSEDDKLSKEEKAEANERRKQIIQKIEEQAEVSTGAVRVESFSDWHRFNNLFKASLDVEKSEFGIFGLRNKILNLRAQKAEREKRQQMRELRKDNRPHPKTAEGVALAEKEAIEAGKKKQAKIDAQQKEFDEKLVKESAEHEARKMNKKVS